MMMGIHKTILIFAVAVCNICSVRSQTVPEWFLNPNEREYVGVSYPSESNEAKRASALMSALLRYKAATMEKRKTVAVSQPQTAIAILRENENRIERRASVSTEKARVRYDIIREYTNENGELFIAIKTETDTTARLEIDCLERTDLKRMTPQDSRIHIMKMNCVYRKEMSHGMSYTMTYEMSNDNVSGDIQLFTTIGCRDTFKLSNFRQYVYNTDILNSMINCSWRYSCGNSLHLAYIQLLMSHINSGVKLVHPISLLDNTLISYAHD